MLDQRTQSLVHEHGNLIHISFKCKLELACLATVSCDEGQCFCFRILITVEPVIIEFR